MKYIQLQGTNDRMPIVGLGTWQAKDEVIEHSVSVALELGYRHFDTAFNYHNEPAIGRALQRWFKEGKGKREELFITTKLPHIANRAEDVERFLKMQLERLQLAYVDLYLIHVPWGFVCDEETLTPKIRDDGYFELDVNTNHSAVWKVMESCQSRGLIRNLGVSNFSEEQLERLRASAVVQPQVLQMELHALLQQPALRAYCARRRIAVTSYGSLGSPAARQHFVSKYNYNPEQFPDLLGSPEVTEIAERHNKSPAQILLKFLVQQQVAVIPKSVTEKRLKENIDLFDFELRPSEMDSLKKLDRGEDGRIFNFLFWKGVENHPQYPYKEFLKNLKASSMENDEKNGSANNNDNFNGKSIRQENNNSNGAVIHNLEHSKVPKQNLSLNGIKNYNGDLNTNKNSKGI